ncbi:MAG: hypothetical protein ABJF04_13660 [Reichenbachiella sp.]|uniref:hypothetical protein n=1 Tax=Reichenbachiella sp. TaxID=2184521 RepID=UPI003264BF08
MRTVLCLFIAVMFFFSALGQESAEEYYVLRKEQITIRGRTNINKFECRLDLAGYVMDTLQIELTRVNGDFNFSGLTLNIPVRAFNCRYRLMTQEFRDLLRAGEFPFLNLNITHVDHEVPNKMHMHASLAVAEKRKEELIQDCYVENLGEELLLGGNHTIYLRSYDLEPPRKFFGAVVVKNELDISFEVILTKKIKNEPH